VAELVVLQVGKELKPIIGDLAAFRPDDESDVQLVDFSQPISDLWEEEPPARCVHIFVDVPEMPPPGTSKWNDFRLIFGCCGHDLRAFFADQDTSLTFTFLVVDTSGEPIRKLFAIKKNANDSVTDLALLIKDLIAKQASFLDINLWKPLSFDKIPRDTHSERVKDFLEAPDHRGAVLMEMEEPLRVYFPPGRSLPPEQIHIVAQLPPSEKDLSKGISFASSNTGLTSSLLQRNLFYYPRIRIRSCLLKPRSLSPSLLKSIFRVSSSPM
jgi:hypothetical protein